MKGDRLVVYTAYVCNECGEQKPISDFPICSTKGKRGFQGKCKKCKAEWMRKDRLRRPEAYKNADIKKMYGITVEEYRVIAASQNNACAICKKPERMERRTLSVDHDHKTGVIRGLLCGNCNVGIGNLRDSIEVLQSAIEYLGRER